MKANLTLDDLIDHYSRVTKSGAFLFQGSDSLQEGATFNVATDFETLIIGFLNESSFISRFYLRSGQKRQASDQIQNPKGMYLNNIGVSL